MWLEGEIVGNFQPHSWLLLWTFPNDASLSVWFMHLEPYMNLVLFLGRWMSAISWKMDGCFGSYKVSSLVFSWWCPH
jgi:hypothetical protein